MALAAAEQVFVCRERLASFLGIAEPERVLFTMNTTYALNLALKGLLRAGNHVLISELEHNAVRRPLCRLRQDKGVSFDTFPVIGLSESSILNGIRQRIRPNTAAVICTHASNICSASLPVAKIGALCHQTGLKFIVDAAQSAGILPLQADAMHIDALALPGHKSLYGIQGCGVLALGRRITLETLWEGGSGLHSRDEEMPPDLPERYEAGTLPTPAIVGLSEGIRFVRSEGMDAIASHEKQLFAAAAERLAALPRIQIYASDTPGAVLLFRHAKIPSDALAAHLAKNGICVRAGLHCAPMAHKALHTPPDGAVRISFGYYNTLSDIDALWQALRSE